MFALAHAFGTGATAPMSRPADPDAWRALRRLADSGTTVIAACDSASDAESYAHRTVLMPTE
jgi:hypothetical protein